MKANELMIGDWVKYDKQYFQVDGYVRVPNTLFLKYNGHTAHYEDGCVVAEDTEPIPLTEEILKVNGFDTIEDQPRHEWYDWKLKDECFFITFFGDEESPRGEIEIAGHIYDYTYVHELQHALRLCSLNDLADNFKSQEQ